MAEYSFHEEQQSRSPNVPGRGDSKLVQAVMRYSGGLIKSKEQAMLILLVVAILGLVLTAYLVLQATSGPQSVEPGINPATGERLPDEI